MVYRQNHAAGAARVEPERCEVCKEFPIDQVVHTWTLYGVQLEHYVCGDCLDALCAEMRRREIEYRVAGRFDR